MIPDRDIWAAVHLMAKRYGSDAATEAAERADQLLDEGDSGDVARDHCGDRRTTAGAAGE